VRSICLGVSQRLKANVVTTGIFIATDIFLSLFPLTFIRQLKRPRREKIVLAILMGLGLLASAASVMRLIVTSFYVSDTDPLYDIVIPAIWGCVEEYLCEFPHGNSILPPFPVLTSVIGIFAACVPYLRIPFENVLGRLGLLTSIHQSRSGAEAYAPPRYNESPGYPMTPLNSRGVRSKHQEILIPGGHNFEAGRSTEALYYKS
jgi:hypothetical protein